LTIDIVTILVAAVGGGGMTHATTGAVAWFKSRGDRTDHREELKARVDEHRDKLTLDLLVACRAELAAARLEAAELHVLQGRLAHFEEALDHIESLMGAKGTDDRRAAERRARQFLTRMRRVADAYGAARNEMQIEESRDELKKREGTIDG
jgi:hypothetical protein